MLLTHIAALAVSATCTSGTDPAAMLEANRHAMSGRPALGTLMLKYDYDGQALRGTYTTTFDLSSGRFVEDQRTGIVTGAEGFDGTTPWSVDLSGFSKPQEGGDGVMLAKNRAYRVANAWWREDRGGAVISPAGCGGIKVTPRGGKEFIAFFDPRTKLLSSVREARSFGSEVETRYAAWERREGVPVPIRMERVYGEDPATKETLTLTAASLTPVTGTGAFSPPANHQSDFELPSSGRTTLPFDLVNNHIIVHVRVDGRGPLNFLVDTGGHDILTPSALRALSVPSEGAAPSSGAGEARATSGYAKIAEIDAGGAILRGQTVVTLDFAPLDVEGIRVDGMLGVEFLERFLVTFDYGARTMTLSDPRASDASERAVLGMPIAFRFYGHMPQVEGRVDGMPVRLNVDTGARDEITLTRPFVEANDLRRKYPGGVTLTTGWGVGGPARTYSVRLATVELGTAVVSRPIGSLSAARHGSFSDGSYEGNLGSGLLKRFATTFDYAHRTMYLRPLSGLDADLGSFDRAGMWINLDADGLKVMDVLTGGPADEAGLKAGDIVVEIGSQPAASRSLSDWRRFFKLAPVAQVLPLRFRRDGLDATASIHPRDLLP